jgi:hypothetical protein
MDIFHRPHKNHWTEWWVERCTKYVNEHAEHAKEVTP